jgi:selenide, water dikinase
LALVAMPIAKLSPETIRAILAGGAEVCARAGIPIAGGHSIDSTEPIYGLAVIGTCHPSHVRRNSGARPGDALVLTKPVGVGIYSAAIKRGVLAPADYDEMIAVTTALNAVGGDLGRDPAVHAMTDVTGFGVLGHTLEMARGSGTDVTLSFGRLPLLMRARDLAAAGCVTGASARNWASYGAGVRLPAGLPQWQRDVLTDPQTSGGLLVSCAAVKAAEIVARLVAAGHPAARVIGRVGEQAEMPMIRVEA